ncbi:MAG: FHA domain-containing protein [Ktedonobacterales bacterium]
MGVERVCPRCGRETRSGSHFCQHCGRQLDAQNPYRFRAYAPLPEGAVRRMVLRPVGGEQGEHGEHGERGDDAAGNGYNPHGAAAMNGAVGDNGNSNGNSNGNHDVFAVTGMAGLGASQQRRGGEPVATVETSLARIVVRSLAEGATEEAQEFVLDGRAVTVGRSPSCDIPLEGDQLASRRHALLRSEDDQYVVVDLGSSNGTYVNDLEIREPVVLSDGDRILVGEHELDYYTSPAGPEASLPGARFDQYDESQEPAATLTATNPNVSAISAAAQEQEADQQDNQWDARHDQHGPYAESDQSAPQQAAQPSFAAMSATVAHPPVAHPPAAPEHMNDLQAIRARLAEASQALAQRADSETQQRAMLAQLKHQLAEVLAHERQTSIPSSGQMDELIAVAQQAAADPRHLDNLTALAARASDIAQALEAQKTWASQRDHLLEALDGVRVQLDQVRQG